MKIKEFLELCSDDCCVIAIYDKYTSKQKIFHHPEEAIREYGYFSVIFWTTEKIYGNTDITIITKTAF